LNPKAGKTNIIKEVFFEKKALGIDCAKLSYAEIPLKFS